MMTWRPGILTWLVLAAVSLSGCTADQIMIGQWYRIYTPSVGACPVLEWDFVVDPTRTITGYLLPDGLPRIASLSGQLAADESFWMKATSVAGNRTADVTGRFTSQISVLSIKGDAAGSACDGQTFELPLGMYFALQGRGNLER